LRLQELPGFMAHRLRKSSLWTATALYFLCWDVLKRLLPRPHWHVDLSEEVFGVLLTAGLTILTTLPWHWTGDARRRAGVLRGLAQALVWNALWLGAMIAVEVLVLPAAQPGTPFGLKLPFMHRPLPPKAGMLIANFPMALVFGWFLSNQEGAEDEAKASVALADQARIQTLQAQLHPHTLFNVLSGLTELVREDAETAEEALVQLVDLYRMLMTQATQINLPLARERELITCFLGIMELRLGARLKVRWDWAPWADVLELPPFLLHPLVENAIKHGIAPAREGGIVRVAVSREGDRLQLLVANTGKPLRADGGGGVGLQNLRERMKLMARLKPDLELRQEGEWVIARLSLAWNWPS
jgi:two-component system sensor histidine kinase AlgZ